MKAKHQRLVVVIVSLIVMALGASLILRTLSDTLVFFYTPTQLAQKQQQSAISPERTLRIGGFVKKGSITNLADGGIAFTISDLSQEVHVTYKGLVPSLFREGQGVVAEGVLTSATTLQALTILAKHDETYMPRAVVEQLKASGRWQEGSSYPQRQP